MITYEQIKQGVSVFLALLFFGMGTLNMIYIHPTPAMAYTLLGMLYLPAVNKLLFTRFGFFIPYWLRFLIAFLVIWGSLGVGDLAEYFGL